MSKFTVFTFFTCLFLLSACNNAPAPAPKHAPLDADFPKFYPTETESYIPRSVDDGFWNTDDIDISAINPNRKLISFTFDDSPSKTLENILAVFASYNENNPDALAAATLFCNGHLINDSSLHTLRTAHALGWEMGNHTYSHPDITALSDEAFQTEITRTDELLSTVDGKKLHLFRAPFGRTDKRIKTLSTPAIDWTIDTLDWTGVSSSEIYETVFSQKFDGAIVLMHDGYPNTVEALKRLLPDLKSAGYQVVSVSQMSTANACPLKNGGTYIRARKKS